MKQAGLLSRGEIESCMFTIMEAEANRCRTKINFQCLNR